MPGMRSGKPGMPGMGRRGMMSGMGRRRAFSPERAERMKLRLGLVKRLQKAAFDPGSAAMIAIGGLKDDVRRKQEDIAEDLETTLAKTKTLGLRNAIRMTLKDIYKKQGQDEKVLQHLRTMLAENDAAIQDKED